MNAHNVLRHQRRPTENDCRDALAAGLYRVQGSDSDPNAADALGWSVGTVANVRNRHNTLSVKLLSDAIYSIGPVFVQPLLALHGLQAVDIDAPAPTCDAGKLSPMARCVAKVADMISPESCGGVNISDEELIENAAEIAANFAVANELNARLQAALLKKARG